MDLLNILTDVIYSTVTDCLNKEVKDITNSINYRYNSLILDFTISIKTSSLTKTSHYSDYQQKLYDEVKRFHLMQYVIIQSLRINGNF